MKKDRRIALIFDPKKAIKREDLLNSLAQAARVVHGDPQLGFLDLQLSVKVKGKTVLQTITVPIV
jgi:hypothetical protein